MTALTTGGDFSRWNETWYHLFLDGTERTALLELHRLENKSHDNGLLVEDMQLLDFGNSRRRAELHSVLNVAVKVGLCLGEENHF